MAEKIEKIEDLDPTKVQEAIDQFWVEKVKQTLVDRDIEWISQEDISTPVQEEIQTQPTWEDVAPPTEPWAIPWVVPEQIPEPDKIPTEPPKLDTEKKITPKTEEVVEQKAPPTEPWAIPDVVPTEEVKSEIETTAEAKNYTFAKDNEWKVVFNPKTLDEALALYQDFGTGVNIDTTNKLFNTAKKIKKQFSKYQWASADVILQWFKTNDIWVSWPTWDLLVSMNGWVATPQMIAAQREFEGGLKLTNAQNTTSYISGEPTETQITITWNTLADLDKAYLDKVNELFWDITADWNTYKDGNDELWELNEELNGLSEDIDELNVEKRRVLDNIKERHPNLPLSSQLAIADKELDAIDDQLFVKQREYNSTLSTYKFKSEEAKADFEFNQSMATAKLDLLGQMYGIKRGDVIRQQDIERQDKILADQIAREDELYNKALADGRKDAATAHAYQKAILKFQDELNKDVWENYKAFWGNIVWVRDPLTWKVTFQTVGWDTETEDWVTPEVTPSWNLVSMKFKTPAGTQKILEVDEVWATWLATAIETIQMESVWWNQVTVWDTYRSTERQTELHEAFKTGTGWLAAAPWTSLHETGMAIDVYRDQDLNPLTQEQVEIMNRNGWYQPEFTLAQWDTGHFVYKWTTPEVDTTDWFRQATLQDVINQWWGWVAWQQLATTMLGRMAFWEWRALSDWDVAIASQIVKSNPNLWLETAARQLSWYILVWEANEELWEGLLATAKWIQWEKTPPLSSIALSLNNWNESEAIRALERYAINQVPANERVNEDKVRAVTERVNELKSLIEQAEKNEKIWPMEWTFENWLGRFKDPDVQQIKNRIQRLVAKWRNEIAWVAMTDVEMELLRPLFPDIDQSVESIKDAYNQFWVESLRELNTFRNNLWLPSLMQTQVWQRDISDRASLYTWEEVAQNVLSKQKIAEIIKNAPAWTDTKKLLEALIKQWYTLEWYGW